MADLGDTFDPNAVPEDERNFDPFPAGDYLCQVIESDVVRTKSGNGDMLKLTIEVMDGPFANRKIWDQLNIRHENPQAQSIAQRALADLCQAVGVGAIRNSEELHFKPFIARVAIDQDKAQQYPPKNVVKRYRPRGGQPPVTKAAPQPAQSAPSQPQQNAYAATKPPATGARPWARQTA